METRVKTMRTETRDLVSEFNKTEDDLKALQVRMCMCPLWVLKFSRSGDQTAFCVCAQN